VNGGCVASSATLGHHISRTVFAATALRGHTELKLDFIETHASVCMARNFAVGDSVAYTNDHGLQTVWLAIDVMKEIINENSSHLQAPAMRRVKPS